MKTWISAALLVVTLTACSSTIVYRAQPLEGPDVRVLPLQVTASGGKLWLRVDVTNASEGTIAVNRDYIKARLPSGQIVSRAQGTFGIHNAYTLPPGAMHAVYVEFEQQGVRWDDIAHVRIDFSLAITRDGKPVSVPELALDR